MSSSSLVPAIAVDKLQATLSQVITTMLGIGLDESNLFPPGQEMTPPVFLPTTMFSAVRFYGSWRGSCVVSCEPAVAKELTFRFLGLSGDTAEDMLDEIRDCMGEVANIVGGNVKSLLPRGIDHSVPEFGYSTPPQGEAVLTAAFNCTNGPLWISLLRDPAQG
jgi:hypothetical protein